MVPQAHRDRLVQLDPLDRLVPLAYKEPLDSLVPQDSQEQPEPLVYKA